MSDIHLQKSVEITSEMSGKKCEICKEVLSNYKCPRCRAWYCSITCYRSEKHLSCSENFYKEQVMSELQTKKASEQDKQKMLDMLQRINSEDADRQDDLENLEAESLAERMKDLDFAEADFEDIWKRLTNNERKIFEEVVNEGEIELDQICTPWWFNKCVQSRDRKILEIEQPAVSENEQEIPELIKELQSMNQLLPNREPSLLIAFNIAEVISVYAFVYRLYNGEMDDSVIDVLDTITSMSKVLESNHTHADLESCLTLFVQSIKESQKFSGTIDPVQLTLHDFITIINSDVKPVGSGNKVIVSVLCISDIYKLFSIGLELLKNKKAKTTVAREKRQKYLQIKRKLYFMASWLMENEKTFSELKKEAFSVKNKLENYWKNIQTEKDLFEKNIKSLKVRNKFSLIEELN